MYENGDNNYNKRSNKNWKMEKMDEGIKQWQEWPQLTKHLKKTNASEY